MKHVIFLTAALLCGNLFFTQPKTADITAETYVYICTGPNSKCYHRTADCKGLKKCSKEVKKVTLTYAKGKQRTPCRFCYGHK